MKKTTKIIIGVILAVIIVAVAIFAVYRARTAQSEDVSTTTNTMDAEKGLDENAVSEQTTDPMADQLEEDTKVDNKNLAQEIVPPTDMEEIINANQDSLTTQVGDGNTSYPGNLIPLYRSSQVGDVNDVTTSNGKPGWTLTYGSDAGTEDIAAFYTSLLDKQENYTRSTEEQTIKITATVSGYNVSISISPNNPQRTGLNHQSDVQIFIEQQ